MAALVRQGLTEEGHRVLHVGNGLEAVDQGLAPGAEPFEAVILDVMLPGQSGIEVVRQLRQRGQTMPVILLTARDTQADIVTGLDAGADDYLTKPFSFSVLLARLRALARRAPLRHDVLLEAGDLVLDPAAHTARRGSHLLPLTKTEFRLLECLMRRSGRVATRQALTESLWGFERDVEGNTLDVFVRLLRQKVDPPGTTPLIHTVRGVGYRIGDGDHS